MFRFYFTPGGNRQARGVAVAIIVGLAALLAVALASTNGGGQGGPGGRTQATARAVAPSKAASRKPQTVVFEADAAHGTLTITYAIYTSGGIEVQGNTVTWTKESDKGWKTQPLPYTTGQIVVETVKAETSDQSPFCKIRSNTKVLASATGRKTVVTCLFPPDAKVPGR